MGLGNPGERYAHTRHNVGYKTVELLVRDYKSEFSSNTNNLIETANVEIYNCLVIVVRALTFMNTSGVAIGQFMKKHDLELKDLMVVYDDVDLSPGKIKLKPGGGSGGHKGIKSIISNLGSKSFSRLKIGIGHPGNPDHVSDYVLSEPKNKEEMELLQGSMQRAKKAIRVWASHGIHETMNKFN